MRREPTCADVQNGHREFLSPQEFADLVGVSKGLTYKLIDGGLLRSLKLGARRLIPASEIDRLKGIAGEGATEEGLAHGPDNRGSK
jgi:excisionase family DNA binding protein